MNPHGGEVIPRYQRTYTQHYPQAILPAPPGMRLDRQKKTCAQSGYQTGADHLSRLILSLPTR